MKEKKKVRVTQLRDLVFFSPPPPSLDAQEQSPTGNDYNVESQKPYRSNQALRIAREHTGSNALNSPSRLSNKGSQKPLSPPSYIRGEGLKDAQPVRMPLKYIDFLINLILHQLCSSHSRADSGPL